MRLWHSAKTLRAWAVRLGQSRVLGPGRGPPSSQGGTHRLSSSSQRGARGHGAEVGTVDGLPVVGGTLVGAQQLASLLSGTSQVLAMSWQVGAMVPSGRRQSSAWLLVQVPGRMGAGGSPRGPGLLSHLSVSPPALSLSYEALSPEAAVARREAKPTSCSPHWPSVL